MTSEQIQVEVAYATPEKQRVLSLDVPSGSTVSDVIRLSGLSDAFPESDLDSLARGIWGNQVAGTQIVVAGDRVEIYRPLETDPREARRKRAQSKATVKAKKRS